MHAPSPPGSKSRGVQDSVGIPSMPTYSFGNLQASSTSRHRSSTVESQEEESQRKGHVPCQDAGGEANAGGRNAALQTLKLATSASSHTWRPRVYRLMFVAKWSESRRPERRMLLRKTMATPVDVTTPALFCTVTAVRQRILGPARAGHVDVLIKSAPTAISTQYPRVLVESPFRSSARFSISLPIP